MKSGDIVQFGVDVLENAYKEKHGCIVTLLRFCTGNEDMGLDLSDPDVVARLANSASGLSAAASGNNGNGGNGGPSGTHSLSAMELYRLNAFIQEAMQREQILETKLMNLLKIVERTRLNTADVWSSMIEEDHLLSRIDILENKLMYYQKNVSDDKLRAEMCKMQDDKLLYQASAKEALRRVYKERNDAVMKLSSIERALCSSEDEVVLLREQLLKSESSFREIAGALAQLEEARSSDVISLQCDLADANRQHEVQVSELVAQLREKEEAAQKRQADLQELQEKFDDLHSRMETYAQIGGKRERRHRQSRHGVGVTADSNGENVTNAEEDDENDDDEDGEDDDDDEEEADEEEADDVAFLLPRKSGSSTVNSWLDMLMTDVKSAKSERKDAGNGNSEVSLSNVLI